MTLGIDAIMGVWLWNGWHEGKDGIPWGVLAEGTPCSVHVASFIFFAWGCAMVSKSLKVPKL